MAIFCQWQEQISSTRSCQKSTLFFSGELCFQSILFLILPMVIQLSFYLSLSFKPSIRILASLKQELGPFCLVFVFVLFLSCFNFIFNSKKDDHQLMSFICIQQAKNSQQNGQYSSYIESYPRLKMIVLIFGLKIYLYFCFKNMNHAAINTSMWTTNKRRFRKLEISKF